jgi:hypothetical protein
VSRVRSGLRSSGSAGLEGVDEADVIRSAESPGVARRPTRRTNTIILSDSE